ncbi:TetR family transcriptional regulator [Pseudomonas fulva]|uniref:TetR/AcrR family transcriptional regulator n=1 Tax=Pseudomonas fulva TaxID=47880 RepID=UPI00201DB3A9|nr:TetR family transcriptional regulator [Pseudomonas fulva]UQY33045.1 TetR family transcriptional regulator [Pseudomonas fulva]
MSWCIFSGVVLIAFGASMARPKQQDTSALSAKDIIIEAALALILEDGVAGATARRIAAKAGLSPGTITYHFKSIDEILYAAFFKTTNKVADFYYERLSQAKGQDEAREVVVDLICGDFLMSSGQMVLILELYAFISRRPEYQALMHGWMKRSREALKIHFSEEAARGVDALIEGIVLHNFLNNRSISREETLRLVTAITK